MIYLDNAATTKPHKDVIQTLTKYYDEKFFNPSALYNPAYSVADDIASAREYIGKVLGGGGKVYFTSCATESNAWALTSGVKNKKGNVLVSIGEHSSVYENAKQLQSKGIDVRFIKLNSDGTLNINDLIKNLDENTTLVSVIHCSNETGAVNDLKEISAVVKKVAPDALIHSDGVQALGKIPVNVNRDGIDLYSISAHKIGGVKGVGGLWIKNGVHMQPFLYGGGQENGMRSGTENAAGIISFAAAIKAQLQTNGSDIENIRNTIIQKLNTLSCVSFNLSKNHSPYILSLSVRGAKAEMLQRLLAEKDILIGLGTACASKQKGNRVLAAMGRSMPDIEGNIRISFSPNNLNDDINKTADEIYNCIKSFTKLK